MEIIKRARTTKHLSLKDISERTGISREQIRLIESGTAVPTNVEIYEKIFNALCLDFEKYKERVFSYVLTETNKRIKQSFFGG